MRLRATETVNRTDFIYGIRILMENFIAKNIQFSLEIHNENRLKINHYILEIDHRIRYGNQFHL